MVKIASSALLLFAALPAWGCAPELTCDETFDGGGDVVGASDTNADGIPDSRWVVTEPCEDIVSEPPEPVTLQKQPPHLSGNSPPKQASGEWCMNLSLIKDDMGVPQIKEGEDGFYPWIPRLPLQQHSAPGQPVWYDAYVDYGQDNQYAFGAVLSGVHRIEIPAKCMTQQGVPMTCAGLIPGLTEKYAETDAQLGKSTGTVSTSNWACANAPSGYGCECAFNMTVTYDATTGPGGTFAASDDLLTHFDQVGEGTPFLTNYTVSGNTLSMSGYRRRALFGIDGLRTLKLQRVVCNDGVQGVGEEGVDCGYNCPAAPTCP
ncbi:MAG TPA: hypothetical protein VM686_21275 [Polyangiaceae bacterium]|nr:hypothetical protein [Polyangiaceae bacterium]